MRFLLRPAVAEHRDVVCRMCGLIYREALALNRERPREWGTCPRCGASECQYVHHVDRDAGRDDR